MASMAKGRRTSAAGATNVVAAVTRAPSARMARPAGLAQASSMGSLTRMFMRRPSLEVLAERFEHGRQALLCRLLVGRVRRVGQDAPDLYVGVAADAHEEDVDRMLRPLHLRC